VVRAPSEQGDGDQEGLKIVLTGAPAAKASKVEVAGKKSKWAVQVGEFRSKSDAHHQIALVEKKFAEHVGGGRGQADKVGRKYKALFVGLSESDAKDACRAMKSKRLACMVVAPA
jgi:D-alanyl-D-alanine carboxypeptidase (penicillin-binding protein 5/6)